MTPEEHLNQVIIDIKKDAKVHASNLREICRTARDTLESMYPVLKVTVDLHGFDRLDIERVTDAGWAEYGAAFLRIDGHTDLTIVAVKNFPSKKMSKTDIDAYLVKCFNDDRIVRLFNVLEEK